VTKFLLLLAACGGGGSDVPDAAIPDSPPPIARTIYLNRTGGTFTSGITNSSTNAMNQLPGGITLPAATVDEAEWTAFVSCVSAKFAPYFVTVTETDPGTAIHTEVAVANTPDQLGFPGQPVVALPSSAGCTGAFGALDPRGLSFLVWDQADTGRCHIATAALGVSFGANTVAGCTDVMTNAVCPNSDSLGFTDADVPCASPGGLAEPCRCGLTSQNSHSLMVLRLGLAQ
jgi:hypothetical protein